MTIKALVSRGSRQISLVNIVKSEDKDMLACLGATEAFRRRGGSPALVIG